MTTRGVMKPSSVTVTSRMTGAFRRNDATRREFLTMIRGS
jgi:GTP cyclohydrolase I